MPKLRIQPAGFRCRQLPLCLAFFLYQFSLPASLPVQACDDSLITIFQAQNPDERFTGQVSRLISCVKGLAELISRGDYQKSREQLFALMQLWLEFDTGYLMQPPFPVEDMSIWREQSSRIAERIGAIHAKIKANLFDRVHPDLDFLVADLTNLYAQKTAQLPLFQTLIRLDTMAAALNPALEDGTGIASSAHLFFQTMEEWKHLDQVPEHRQDLDRLQSLAQTLSQIPPRDLLRQNDLCQSVRSEYETLKRRFVK